MCSEAPILPARLRLQRAEAKRAGESNRLFNCGLIGAILKLFQLKYHNFLINFNILSNNPTFDFDFNKIMMESLEVINLE